MLKYLGHALHRFYGQVVKQPLPWPVIDKLSSLDEACEATDDRPRQGDPTRQAKGGEPYIDESGDATRSPPVQKRSV